MNTSDESGAILLETLRKKAKSYLELTREKRDLKQELSNAQIGDASRKVAFRIMHFMEDKQWVKVSDIELALKEES